jgi:hypothetical protein
MNPSDFLPKLTQRLVFNKPNLENIRVCFCFMAKIPETFYRKGRKDYASYAKALRSLRKHCSLCGKKVVSL